MRRPGRAGAAGASSSRGAAPSRRRPSPAEAGLLELARALDAAARAPTRREALARALGLLEGAFGARAPLPRQLAQAWLRARGDKTVALALGWAREQVRRALAEAVTGAPPAGRPEPEPVPPDSAAWLLLAAAEAESHEVGGAVGDRLRSLCALLALG